MYLILTWQHREILSDQAKVDAEYGKGSRSEIAHLSFLTNAYSPTYNPSSLFQPSLQNKAG